MTERRLRTLAVHAGDAHATAKSGTEAGVVFSNTFLFDDAEDARASVSGESGHYVYTRWGNPTVEAFERKLAALEGAEAAVALASGMAAIYGVITTFASAGDHVVAPDAVYGETVRALDTRIKRFGVDVTYVDMTNTAALEAAMTPRTKLVWSETPANPTLAITNLRRVAEVAHAKGALAATDSTFATPFHQTPLAHGIDLVVHSATKAIGGHGDAIAGVVAGTRETVERVRKDVARAAGAILSPMNAFLMSRGLATLPLRAKAASESAFELARRLEADPRIERVYYPGLESHPGHNLAKTQMEGGFGAVIAFEVKGGVEAGRALYDGVELLARAVSVGDLRSLITHSATTTHASVPREQRLRAGISDALVRVSVGIEDVEDIWADLDRALSA
ncbi:MAG: aminotransferase class I/II-fold pyridoxal phosphate-dependent enzyme [Polyangiales bacterium]